MPCSHETESPSCHFPLTITSVRYGSDVLRNPYLTHVKQRSLAVPTGCESGDDRYRTCRERHAQNGNRERQRRRRDAIIVATGQHRHIGRRQILEGFTDNGLLIDAHIVILN